ncbi:MAG: NYN domain-containing protein [Erysipelotrichaceae bacterium]|nr:NYN domain-containing protein [Erysipelotrichaceae bacterium]
MAKIVLGALAHVDAGKTSLSEAILYKTGAIRKKGRIDHQDTFLDTNSLEKEKGITIFLKEGRFSYKQKDYIYLDTPGHHDLFFEANRALRVIDVAIIIIAGNDSIPSDTIKHFRDACEYEIPVIFFVNKMDISYRDQKEIINELREKTTGKILIEEEFYEEIAMESEEAMDNYLANGIIDHRLAYQKMLSHECFPIFFGSALKDQGIDELLDFLDQNIEVKDEESDELSAYVYKVSSSGNERLTSIKVLSGTLKNRLVFDENNQISEILTYSGNSHKKVQEVTSGDICTVKGLKDIRTGTYLPSLYNEDKLKTPPLSYRLLFEGNPYDIYRKIMPIKDEFPETNLTFHKDKNEITINLEGSLQMEIIRHLISQRYQLSIDFSEPIIEYRETISSETFGVGHFEPLRHYGEAIVHLSPNQKGLRIRSLVNNSYAAPLLSYLSAYPPKGLLTNSKLDNLTITIVDIRTNIKHTEGQDLIQSLRRAIRQGLTKTESILLEPFYHVRIKTNETILSKIIKELEQWQFSYDLFDGSLLVKIPAVSFARTITSLKQKLKDSLDYDIEDEIYDKAQNERTVIERIGYDYRSDADNPAGSLFCSHGAGHYVAPEEVESHMHMNLSDYLNKDASSYAHNHSTISDAELQRVWNSIYKQKPLPKANNTIAKKESDETPRPIDLNDKRELMYLIDGYNLLFYLNNDDTDIDIFSKREEIISLVSDFAGYVSAKCVLVFDGYLTTNRKNTIKERDNITIVYTKEGQTADTYIENHTSSLKNDYRVIVVTSDGLEQLKILANASTRLSSSEFIKRYENMKKNHVHQEIKPNRPLSELIKLLEE